MLCVMYKANLGGLDVDVLRLDVHCTCASYPKKRNKPFNHLAEHEGIAENWLPQSSRRRVVRREKLHRRDTPVTSVLPLEN